MCASYLYFISHIKKMEFICVVKFIVIASIKLVYILIYQSTLIN